MKRVNKNYNSKLVEMLAIKPVLFNPLLAKLAKSTTAGLFLSQLLYWWKKGFNPEWIYKTIKEFQEETTITRSGQETAIKIWVRLGVLTVKKCGIPPTRYFHIDESRLAQLIKASVVYANCGKPANQFAENDKSICEKQPYIPESTADSTTDI